MKLNISKQSFYILKYGSILTIAMIAVTLLYFDTACCRIDDYTLYLRALGVAREMLITSVLTYEILLGGAFLFDIAVKSKKN